jgi:hypothetical protein
VAFEISACPTHILLALGTLLATAKAPLSELESLQEIAIVEAMATAATRVPKGQCLRYFICISNGDPTLPLKRHLHASYGGRARWCSGLTAASEQSDCEKTTIRVLEPLQLSGPIIGGRAVDLKKLEFSVEGPVSLRCTIRVDAGFPTTGTTCVALNPKRCRQSRRRNRTGFPELLPQKPRLVVSSTHRAESTAAGPAKSSSRG